VSESGYHPVPRGKCEKKMEIYSQNDFIQRCKGHDST
jgi:hypothetical protein